VKCARACCLAMAADAGKGSGVVVSIAMLKGSVARPTVCW